MPGIMYDLDGDHFYHSRANHLEIINEEYLKSVMRQYKGTQITDFVMSINGVLSSVPSKIKTTYAEKYLKEEEMGVPVNYKDTNCIKTAHHVWNVLGLDLYKIWIDTLKEININPWFSFRMNDTHCQIDPMPNFLQSDFFYEHMDDYARITGRKPEFYFDRARNWLIDDVRKEMFDYIKEQLDAYDIYGVVLDFQREFRCFPPGREDEGREIITEFVRQIKELTVKMGEKYGHYIKLAIRMNPEPQECYELGFDIIGYAKEGLIDMYIASPRWLSTNSDMPIAYWKTLLKPYGVELAGGTERMIQPYPGAPLIWNNSETNQTVLTHFGNANNILSQGADKYYVFNSFDETDEMIDSSCKYFELIYKSPEISGQDGTYKDGTYTLLSNAGSMDTIKNYTRKCMVSFNDFRPVWKKLQGELPLNLTREYFSKASEPYYLKINTGKVYENDTVYLRLGVDGNGEDIDILVNDKAVEFICIEDVGFPKATKNKVYKYRIENKNLAPISQVIELIYRGNTHLTVDYADILVIPGDKNEK